MRRLSQEVLATLVAPATIRKALRIQRKKLKAADALVAEATDEIQQLQQIERTLFGRPNGHGPAKPAKKTWKPGEQTAAVLDAVTRREQRPSQIAKKLALGVDVVSTILVQAAKRGAILRRKEGEHRSSPAFYRTKE